MLHFVAGLEITLNKAIPAALKSNLTLHVGSSQYPLANATLRHSNTAFFVSRTRDWSASDTVELSLVEPPPPPPATVWLSLPDVQNPNAPTVREGESITVMAHISEAPSGNNVEIPITLTPGSGNVGAEPEDYGPLTGITINDGQTTGTGTIETNHDDDTKSELLYVEIDDDPDGSDLVPSIGTRVNPYIVGFTIIDDDTTTDTTRNEPPTTNRPPSNTGSGSPPPSSDEEPLPEDEEPSTSCPREDREILESFYEMTDGESWHENGNWDSEEPLGEWHGVDTDEGEVVSLRLPDNGLSGNMPTGELLCLKDKELVELALWGNDDLSGEVPENLVLAVERAALRYLAETLDINPEWFEDYGDPYDFEDWHEGVTTDDGRVTGLDFTEEGVIGEIPENIFELLPRLGEIMVTRSSGDGGCALSPEDSSVFSLFLLTLLVFAVLGRRRARRD